MTTLCTTPSVVSTPIDITNNIIIGGVDTMDIMKIINVFAKQYK